MLGSLEVGAYKAVLQLPVAERGSLDEIVAHLEVLYRPVAVTTHLRTRFFTRVQREEETLPQFAVALWEFWNRRLAV